MNLQESIRRVLREETKSGKYIPMLEDLTEEFKNEDCVCDIKIGYNPDENNYLINVKVGTIDLDDKFNGINYQIKDYINRLGWKIKKGIQDYLPIPLDIEFKQTPKCKDYKNLQESENKKPKLLSNIEEDGLYQVMKDTGLSLPQIISKTGELSREVLERYIKDFVENEAESIAGSDGDIGFVFPIPLSKNKEVESFYMSKGNLTLEINEYDSNDRVVMGSHERLINLSDKELFVIVDKLSHVNDDYFDVM